ncbi:hypothetical protein J6590_023893 [Homalodisca vitripennis]|nr:hypothetical protein J6590_023893 [Homalodisca vitripennis]
MLIGCYRARKGDRNGISRLPFSPDISAVRIHRQRGSDRFVAAQLGALRSPTQPVRYMTIRQCLGFHRGFRGDCLRLSTGPRTPETTTTPTHRTQWSGRAFRRRKRTFCPVAQLSGRGLSNTVALHGVETQSRNWGPIRKGFQSFKIDMLDLPISEKTPLYTDPPNKGLMEKLMCGTSRKGGSFEFRMIRTLV